MLSKQQVQHIAKLARIDLSDAELEKYRKDLSAILDYISKLHEVDTEVVGPTSHPLSIKNVAREDKPYGKSPEVVAKIMEQAPEREEGYVKVRAVFD